MLIGSNYATRSFKWSELRCHCGCGTSFIEDEALYKLQQLRDIIGVPFSPNSAARCPIHNARIGGKPMSFHKSEKHRPARAFDIPIIVGMPKNLIISAAEEVGFKGIGINYRTFVHVDNRPYKARW